MPRPDPKLLNDAQMREFLTNGFLVLQPDVAAGTHERIREQLGRMRETYDGNPGNNVLPHVPDIQRVFDAPNIRGALQSVVGERYIMHPHRHMHANSASAGGGWHKDSYWGYKRKIRNHRPWWVMIMYYPQEVTVEMGPTAVLRGRQCHENRGPADDNGEARVTGPAGTCFLIHYDLWHRASPNISGKERYMLKFEFIRMDAPAAPSWDCQDEAWQAPEHDLPPAQHHGMWRQHWNWLRGVTDPAARTGAGGGEIEALLQELKNDAPEVRARAADDLEALGPEAARAIPALAGLLSDAHEPAALNAAYALASIGPDALPAVIDRLGDADENASRNATFAAAAMGPHAVPGLLKALKNDCPQVRARAVFALGEIRVADRTVLDAVAGATQDEDVTVRIHAVEALGLKGASATPVLGALCDALKDSDPEVRFDAALALTRMGPAAQDAVPALEAGLSDENRYVRGYAVDALHHIGTTEALGALIPYLKTARWCTSTTPESTFYP